MVSERRLPLPSPVSRAVRISGRSSWFSMAAASALLFYAAPAAYAAASAWAWCLVCLASGFWCASEVRAWLGEGARGFAPRRGDVRSPLDI